MSEVVKYGKWGSVCICNNCASEVNGYDIYKSCTCWSCGNVSQYSALPHIVVPRRKAITGYKGFWPFKKEVYHYEYKELVIPEKFRGMEKFNLPIKPKFIDTIKVGSDGFGAVLFKRSKLNEGN